MAKLQLLAAAMVVGRAVGFGMYTEEEMKILVGNTRGGNVVAFSTEGMYLGEVAAGIDDPDDLVMYDGDLYVSQGTMPSTSKLLKCGSDVGSTCETFAEGGGLHRPYGFAFGGGYVYVASFLTDQVLRYDAMSGDFVDVFAAGNATEEGLVNGPNGIDIADGKLYLTTQGSVAVNGSPDYSFGLQSKVVVFDLATGAGETFIDDIAPIGGFVSLLGVKVVGDVVYISDFAAGLRKYDLADGTLLATYDTAFTDASHWIGSLDVVGDDMYAVGFVNNETAAFPGVVLKYDLAGGGGSDGLADLGADNILVSPSTMMVRPIGCLVV